MGGVAGEGAVALEGGDGGVPHLFRDKSRHGSRYHLAAVRSGRSSSVLEETLVDGIDDEIADMAGAPEALGAFASNAAAVAGIRGGDAERVEGGSDTRTGPAVRAEMVIDATNDIGGGEVFPHERVIGIQILGPPIARDPVAQRIDLDGLARWATIAVRDAEAA